MLGYIWFHNAIGTMSWRGQGTKKTLQGIRVKKRFCKQGHRTEINIGNRHRKYSNNCAQTGLNIRGNQVAQIRHHGSNNLGTRQIFARDNSIDWGIRGPFFQDLYSIYPDTENMYQRANDQTPRPPEFNHNHTTNICGTVS